MENIDFEQPDIETIVRERGIGEIGIALRLYYLGDAGRRELNKYLVEEELNNQHLYE